VAKGKECKGDLAPVPPSIIKTRVAFGQGLKNDVLLVQQLLNDVPPNEAGPNPKLKEDGICGPKTTAAINAFQKKIMQGFSDGAVDPGGKTINALRNRIIAKEELGKVGLKNDFDEDLMGGGAVPEAIGHLKFLQPSLLTLSFRLNRSSDSVRRLAEKHFVNPGETLTDADMSFLAQVLRDIRVFLDRTNAFGKFPGANVVLFSSLFSGKFPNLLAFTVRGGDKMTTSDLQLYAMPTGKVFNFPGQSIFITPAWTKLSPVYKQEVLIHEFCHFVGDRDDPPPPLPPNANKIDDNAYLHDPSMKFLNKNAKMRNAESLALFFMEFCVGTKAIMTIPDNANAELINRAPFFGPSGQLL
jgi:hypothetical protein